MLVQSIQTTSRNALLAALPEEEYERLRPHMQRVSLVLHQVLNEPGNRVEDVHFVEQGLISLTADTGDQSQVEVGMTGRDGIVGAILVLNPDAVSSYRALVQAPGTALRIRADAFLRVLPDCPTLLMLALRYVQYTLVQASQTAACNARHETQQRLARWLLMTIDQLESNDLPMTQEFMSYMLGVRRAGVSVVASVLSARGGIHQSRGRITVTDRSVLEDAACSCYGMIAAQRSAIMGTAT